MKWTIYKTSYYNYFNRSCNRTGQVYFGSHVTHKDKYNIGDGVLFARVCIKQACTLVSGNYDLSGISLTPQCFMYMIHWYVEKHFTFNSFCCLNIAPYFDFGNTCCCLIVWSWWRWMWILFVVPTGLKITHERQNRNSLKIYFAGYSKTHCGQFNWNNF